VRRIKAAVWMALSCHWTTCSSLNDVDELGGCLVGLNMVTAEILWDPYSKKYPLPSIGDFPHLADSPKLSSYQVLGQSSIQQRHITHYNHPRIDAQ
jgi:hypothetical protein